MHPLQVDFSNLTDNELDEKIKELTKKYFTILRVSPSASGQLLMILDDYRNEQQLRNYRRDEERKKDLGDEFDGLINIG